MEGGGSGVGGCGLREIFPEETWCLRRKPEQAGGASWGEGHQTEGGDEHRLPLEPKESHGGWIIQAVEERGRLLRNYIFLEEKYGK